MDETHIADQLLAAGTTLAGLVLVFLSGALSTFQSYETDQQDAVRKRFQLRGWLAFAAFAASAASAAASLAFYRMPVHCLIVLGEGLFAIALILALVAAVISAWDIR